LFHLQGLVHFLMLTINITLCVPATVPEPSFLCHKKCLFDVPVNNWSVLGNKDEILWYNIA
jgi:hypothetical protein